MSQDTELSYGAPATGVHDGLRLHTLVTATPGALAAPLPPRARQLVQLCRQPLSVAEITAALGLSVEHTRVLVTELLRDGHVGCDQLDEELLPPEVIERIAHRVRGL